MNWLTPLCQEIMKLKSLPREHRDTLILWASELSGICDSFAKRAPAPTIYYDATWCHIGWWFAEERGLLAVTMSDGSVALVMHHGEHKNETPNPTHAQLKSAVRGFFEASDGRRDGGMTHE